MTKAGGYKLAVPSERQVQRAILTMARACFPDVLLHHSPNGAHLAGNDTARFKQVGALLGDGMRKGFPDLIAIWDGGVAFLEVKRPKLGRVSPEQLAIQDLLFEMGHHVRNVMSAEDAHAFLKHCGAPCIGELS